MCSGRGGMFCRINKETANFIYGAWNMKINDVIHGFKLIRSEKVQEIASQAFEFKHVKSGARLLYLQNKDDNKVFSISFRTPPADDTGVPHIIEHSTLCGSRKFPLKEPFVELVKGSLNTFLNAMTYPDKTMYPVASCNDKDFHNLMDVYLDAVFYPSIYSNPEILMQEGWHYEIEEPAAPLEYSGVVYNEMKGALSSPEDLLENKVMAALFPDTAYSCESGGNPAAIPQLTYEKFIDFHKKYYSPANSYIFLYGDMDIEKQLAFINDEYLQHFDMVQVDSALKVQQPLQEFQHIQGKFPIAPEESPADRSFLSYNLVMAEAGDHELISAISVLEQALLKTPSAPIRRALLDAGLGMDVSSHFETNVLQPYLSITINGTEPDKAEAFQRVLRDSLQELVTNGIDRTILEAAINLLEFQTREADFGSYPKGLIYNIVAMTNWLYDHDPLEKLRYEKDFQHLRSKLATDYYEQLLQKYFLDNKFGALVVMEPDSDMAQQQEDKLAAELAAKKAAMSPEEIQRIIDSTAQLKLHQQTPDTPEALATIPLLQLEDIAPEPAVIPLEEKALNGVKVLFTPADTNGIVYLNLYFDAMAVPRELLPYAYLFADMLGLTDTESSTYEEMTNRVNLNTGGIAFSLDVLSKDGDADAIMPVFRVSAKALLSKLPELADILGEILTQAEFTDEKRVLELLQQNRSETELDMLNASVQVALTRLNSFISAKGMYNEQGGLTLYPLLKKLTDEFDEQKEDFCHKLAQVMQLLTQGSFTIGITAETEAYEKFAEGIKPLIQLLQQKTSVKEPAENYGFLPESQQEALLSSSQVQYVGKGANLCKLGYEVTGAYRVLEVILKYDYFWTKIRVQGGAYGAMTRISQDGDLLFISYRDPGLAETVEVFDGTADYLESFDAAPREILKYIIGAISAVDSPLTPRMKGVTAQRMYFRGTTWEARCKRRQQLLNTTRDTIRQLAPAIRACMEQNNLCIFGNAMKIKENEQLFTKLTPVME